jgi:formate dehydrogenase major subunit
VAGLAPTFGRGAMTNHWVDIKNADIVLIMGGNAKCWRLMTSSMT